MTNLLLSARIPFHTTIHQLKIIDEYTLYTIFPYQALGLVTELADGDTMSIINVKRRGHHKIYSVMVYFLPLFRCQAAYLKPFTVHLADVWDNLHHQLLCTHFKTEKGCRYVMIKSRKLRRTQRKRGLTHRRAASNNDQILLLPSGGFLVKFWIWRDSRYAVGMGGSVLNTLYNTRQYTG